MPQSFENCRKNGGKIRTKTVNDNQYMHICILNGKTYSGEVKTRKIGGFIHDRK
jgi:hypothetical protein